MTAVDPLAHVTAGDPDPDECLGDFHREVCPALRDGYGCTRLPGHPGQHIAGSGGVLGVCATWPGDS